MRISDWSSDVCSSDLLLCPTHHTLIDRKENEAAYPVELLLEMKAAHEARILDLLDLGGSPTKGQLARSILPLLEESRQSWRSEARRVGKECVSTCRYRWSPYP